MPIFDSDRLAGRLNAVFDCIHDKFGSAALTTADLHETGEAAEAKGARKSQDAR